MRVCYTCGHYIYWDDQSLSWCHLPYPGFKITHTAQVSSRGRYSKIDPLLVIQEEP